MSIPNTRRREIRPTHPGEMLREDFLPDYGLTVKSAVDLWEAERALAGAVERIRPLDAA